MTSPNGLLLVDKPAGVTSHDVVARVRQIFSERRVGHAGTLDPLATGLLVVALGPSTRLLRFAQAETKRYSGTVKLGTATSSLDADGEVVSQAPVPELTLSQFNALAREYVGEIDQVPPMVSAIKINGRRLHEMARAGEHVERAPRHVTVHSFQLTPSSDPSLWNFVVDCSSGTYVRVLLSDLAERAGTVGHLVALRRELSGNLDVADAYSLDQLADVTFAALRAPREMVTSLHSTVVPDAVVVNIRHGKRVDLDVAHDIHEVAALSESGELVAILVRRNEQFKPDVVLALDASGEQR
jgi:tRNA pseudouridine55 synthase